MVLILKNPYPYLTMSPVLSISPNLSNDSNGEYFPLSTKTSACIWGSITKSNNNSFLVIADDTIIVSVIPEEFITKNVFPFGKSK